MIPVATKVTNRPGLPGTGGWGLSSGATFSYKTIPVFPDMGLSVLKLERAGHPQGVTVLDLANTGSCFGSEISRFQKLLPRSSDELSQETSDACPSASISSPMSCSQPECQSWCLCFLIPWPVFHGALLSTPDPLLPFARCEGTSQPWAIGPLTAPAVPGLPGSAGASHRCRCKVLVPTVTRSLALPGN